MSAVKTNTEFVKKLTDIAKNYKTLYVIGCFGAPMTARNKNRYINNGSHNRYNARPERAAMINAASADTFGFDCVGLIKGVLWGWDGDKKLVYGGAVYSSNGVPDIGADQMINVCAGVTKDFKNIAVGEAVWTDGHIGVYIGNGLAVECSPAWENKVQITAVGNIGKVKGYNTRKWKKHGKLPYINYIENTEPKEDEELTEKEIRNIVADEVKKVLAATKKETANEKVSNWAKTAVDYVKDNGIMIGDTDGNFRPQSDITRQEVAQVIYRLLNK